MSSFSIVRGWNGMLIAVLNMFSTLQYIFTGGRLFVTMIRILHDRKMKDFVTLTRMESGEDSFLPGQKRTIYHLITRRVPHQAFSEAVLRYMNNLHLPYKKELVDFQAGRISRCKFTSDGSLFVTANLSGQIVVYDTRTKNYTRIRREAYHDAFPGFCDMDISPCDAFVAGCTIDGRIMTLNLSKPEENMAFLSVNQQQQPRLHKLHYSPGGKAIVALDNLNGLTFVDLQSLLLTLRTVPRLCVAFDRSSCFCFCDKGGDCVFVGSDSGMARVLDLRMEFGEHKPGSMTMHYYGEKKKIMSVDSRMDGRYVVTLAKDMKFGVWDLRLPKRPVHDFEGSNSSAERPPINNSVMVTYAHFSPILPTDLQCYFSPASLTGQRFVYSGNVNGNYVLIDLVTGRRLYGKRVHSSLIQDVAWNPNCNEIVTTGWDGNIYRWKNYGVLEDDFRELENFIY
ncbi:LEC14B protein [Trichinella spiralis]|uniref:LEC14B protein n=2 Tax=Trichinella spiralis TaxID=6334 RepID=A0ABR3KAM4_TRISP